MRQQQAFVATAFGDPRWLQQQQEDMEQSQKNLEEMVKKLPGINCIAQI